jgi:hypothetical protein
MRMGVQGQDPSGGTPWLPSLKITQYLHILVSIRACARDVTKTNEVASRDLSGCSILLGVLPSPRPHQPPGIGRNRAQECHRYDLRPQQPLNRHGVILHSFSTLPPPVLDLPKIAGIRAPASALSHKTRLA